MDLAFFPERRSGGEISYGEGDSADQRARRCSGGHGVLDAANKQTLLEEVNDNNSTTEPVWFPVIAPAEVELPAPAASSTDGQICREDGDAEPASAEKAQYSEQSIEQLDPKTPGWTQRCV